MPVVCIIALRYIDQTSLLGLYTSHILMFYKKKAKEKEEEGLYFSRWTDAVKRPGVRGMSRRFHGSLSVGLVQFSPSSNCDLC